MAVRLLALRPGLQLLIPKKILGAHLYYRLSRSQSRSAVGTVSSNEKPIYLIGNRSHDLPSSNIVFIYNPTLKVLLECKKKKSPYSSLGRRYSGVNIIYNRCRGLLCVKSSCYWHEYTRGCIRNFWNWSCHLYGSCISAMQR
jgi:hypothetical protein